MRNKSIVLSLVFFMITAVAYFFIFRNKTPLASLPMKVTLQKFATPSLPYPSLDSIFSEEHTWTATLSADHIRILTATGDIIPARSVNYQVIKFNNPLWPYEKVLPILKTKKSDILFVNLETPLIKGCPITVDGMVFCGDEKNISGLQALGVTVANIANNHAGNHGIDGVLETKTLLEKADIAVTGVNGPVYKDIRGIKFAFLGYNDITKPQVGIANASDTLISKEISQAKKRADIVIVTYHWGVEYREQPDDDQKRLGHLSIDAGADLVIGNHPHWIQPIEVYKGKLITYAHGNFIFDQMWSQKTKEGVIGRYIFYDTQLIDVEYMPLEIQNYGQAQFLSGEKAETILKDMKKQSYILQQASK